MKNKARVVTAMCETHTFVKASECEVCQDADAKKGTGETPTSAKVRCPCLSAVAWCRACSHYDSQAKPGDYCPSLYCHHKLIKRVGYIADDIAERPIFWTKQDYGKRHDDDGF